MSHRINRRALLKSAAVAATGALAMTQAASARIARPGTVPVPVAAPAPEPMKPVIYKSIKFGMFSEKLPIVEKFKILKDLGFDGVELDSPGGHDKKECRKASEETGIICHGIVCSTHWGTHHSDPSADVRKKALADLEMAIRDTHYVGGTTVLLVPAVVTKETDQQAAWNRSIENIKQAIPLAAMLGVCICMENVWNRFNYVHDGPGDQTADLLAKYVDAFNSPHVGQYFDFSNHRKYGQTQDWIRTLGKRIVKTDTKDFSLKKGFCEIGEGDVEWPEVRKALTEIGYHGWCSAEVGGGDRNRMKTIKAQLDKVLNA
jgi:hexulose-6-phosphate isomerase